jgi:hypothetical protein
MVTTRKVHLPCFSTCSFWTPKITHIKFRKKKRKNTANFLLQLPCALKITNVTTMMPESKLQKVMYGRRNVGSARLGCNVSGFKSGHPGSKLGDNKHYNAGVPGFLQSFQKHVTIAPPSVSRTCPPNPLHSSPNHSTQYNKIRQHRTQ